MYTTDCKDDLSYEITDCKQVIDAGIEYNRENDAYYGCIVGSTDLRAIYKSNKIVLHITKNKVTRTYVVEMKSPIECVYEYIQPIILSQNEQYALICWQLSDGTSHDYLLLLNLFDFTPLEQVTYGEPYTFGKVYINDEQDVSEEWNYVPLNNGLVHCCDSGDICNSYIFNMRYLTATTPCFPENYKDTSINHLVYSEDSICTFRGDNLDVSYNYTTRELMCNNANGEIQKFDGLYNTMDQTGQVSAVDLYGYGIDEHCHCWNSYRQM